VVVVHLKMKIELRLYFLVRLRGSALPHTLDLSPSQRTVTQRNILGHIDNNTECW